MIDNRSAKEGAVCSRSIGAVYPHEGFRPSPAPKQDKESDKAFWTLMTMMVLMGVTGLLALLVVFLVGGFGPMPPLNEAASASHPLIEDPPGAALAQRVPAPLTSTPVSLAAMSPAPSPTNTPVITPTATPTPCINDAVFVADVTLPDGAEVVAGSRIDKTWRLRNTGTCLWREGYRFKFVSGDNLGLVDSIPVVFTDPGASTDVAIPMFAPKSAGEYHSAWQMVDPQGKVFGQPAVMKIVIGKIPASAPAAKSTGTPKEIPLEAGPDIRFWVEDERIQAGDTTRLHVVTEDVAAVWLDGDIVVGGCGVLEIAPCISTTYTLDVQFRSGEHVYQNVAVEVLGSCAGEDYPDLTIDFTVAPVPLFMDQPSEISYTVLNLGNETARGFNVVFNPGPFVSSPIMLMDGFELAPGYGLKSSYSYTWPVSGVYQALIRVDGTNSVEESNEENNTNARVVVVEGK